MERSILRELVRKPIPRTGLVLLGSVVLLALLAGWLSPYLPTEIDSDSLLVSPSGSHWLGTDDLGRDVLSRVLYGSRVSLIVAAAAILVAIVLGTFIGLVAGYLGGVVDTILMRIADGFLTFPTVVLALAIIAVAGPSLAGAILAIGIVNIPAFARMARGDVLSIRQREYIGSALVSGSTHWWIMRKHILPGVAGTMFVFASLRAALAIIAESSLSFLGLGVQPPTPTWGGMIAGGARYLEVAWWMSFFPGLAIFITVLALSFIGDGLNDALNIRLTTDPAIPVVSSEE